MNSNTKRVKLEISINICIPYIDDVYVDEYEMYMYTDNGTIIAAISLLDGKIILLEGITIDEATAIRLFQEFKRDIRSDKIDQII